MITGCFVTEGGVVYVLLKVFLTFFCPKQVVKSKFVRLKKKNLRENLKLPLCTTYNYWMFCWTVINGNKTFFAFWIFWTIFWAFHLHIRWKSKKYIKKSNHSQEYKLYDYDYFVILNWLLINMIIKMMHYYWTFCLYILLLTYICRFDLLRT